MLRVPLVLLCLLFVALAAAKDVGQLTNGRAASVLGKTGVYIPADVGRMMQAGETLRTGRRGFAEVTFNDQSQVRLNERTDLVVEDSATLRRYNLSEGALWVKVAKGSRTEVRTPVGTATARGTIFIVDATTNTVTVLEGTVQAVIGDASILIQAGQSFTYQFGLGWVSQPFPFAVGQGGAFDGWFTNIGGDPGSLAGLVGSAGPGGLAGGDMGTYPVSTVTGGTITVSTTLGAAAFISSLATVTVLLNPADAPFTGEVVPEPASMMALGVGAITLALRRRKPRA